MDLIRILAFFRYLVLDDVRVHLAIFKVFQFVREFIRGNNDLRSHQSTSEIHNLDLKDEPYSRRTDRMDWLKKLRSSL